MSSPPEDAPDAPPATDDAPAGWASADELAARHGVSRRTIFRWLASGQVVSREHEGATQYRVVKGARAHEPPTPAERAADAARLESPDRLREVVADLARRLDDVERHLEVDDEAEAAEARGDARELEQARLLTELATRHAEQSRADLEDAKRRLGEALRALEVERERAYRLALVATLPWWQFRARGAMLAEIAAMKALPLPRDGEAEER